MCIHIRVCGSTVSNKLNMLGLSRLLRVKAFMNLLRDGNIMHCSQCLILTATLERIFDYIIRLFSLNVSCCIFFFDSAISVLEKIFLLTDWKWRVLISQAFHAEDSSC